MSFGNEAVFPFPAVQYIPLQVTEVCQKKIESANTLSMPVQLIIGKDLEKWQSILWQNYQIILDETFPNGLLPVLALNAEVTSARYRSYFVTMLGTAKKGSYHLFTLPQQYFYKKQLYFELFDESTSKRMARCTLTIPD